MYSTIIVPLDGSPHAARALLPAATIARDQRVPLTIMAVASPAFAEETFATIRAQAIEAGVRYPAIEMLISAQAPVEPLLRAIDRRPGSLLCMTTAGQSRLGQLLGGTAEGILRARTGPTLLVGPDCDVNAFKVPGPLLMPTDGSTVAEDIIPLASAWTIGMLLEPEVVSVVDPEIETLLAVAGDTGLESALPAKTADRLETITGGKATWEVLHGDDVATAIVERASETDASLIAMSTHGRTGVGRLVAGSVTMAVVRHARCPVLVQRPGHLR